MSKWAYFLGATSLQMVYYKHKLYTIVVYNRYSFGKANYCQSSLQVPNKKASRRNRKWSTHAGSSLLLLASRMSPAAEKRCSTAVEVAGGVKYLNIVLIRTPSEKNEKELEKFLSCKTPPPPYGIFFKICIFSKGNFFKQNKTEKTITSHFRF